MERNRRWVMAPRRGIISAVLAITAIFVIFAAIGMRNWTVLSVGFAVLAGGAALAVISAMNSKVRGVAHVIEVNAPPAARYRGRVTATAVVRYKGRRDTVRVILREDDVPLNKWPAVHDELPVIGLTNDLWNAEVLWPQVLTHKRIAAKRRRAEARAAPGVPGAAPATATTATTATTAAASGEASASGGGGTATATAERVDQETEDYTDIGPSTDDSDVVTETVNIDESDSDNWSPPGTGKVVEGVWWDSAVDPDQARLEADITTSDYPPATARPAGSRPSPRPRPRTSPDDVIVSVDFGDSPEPTDSPTATAPAEAEPVTGAPEETVGVDSAADLADPGGDPYLGADDLGTDDLGVDDLSDGGGAWGTGSAEVFVPRQPTGPRHAAPDDEHFGHGADNDIDVDSDPIDAGDVRPSGDVEDGMFGDSTSSLRTSPLEVQRAGILAASVPAPRADDEPYDHAYDDEAVAQAYREALPPPGVDRPGHADVTVQLFVGNLSRAIIFYRDILGFTEIDAGRASAVLDLRDVRVILKVVDDLLPTSKNVQFSLEVEDLEAAYEDLHARGVRFVHRPRRVEHFEQLEHFAAPFEDPDGHRISLSSWRSIYEADS